MTLLGAKRPGAWRPRDVLLAAICEGQAVSYRRNCKPEASAASVTGAALTCFAILPATRCYPAALSLRYCVSKLLRYCISALLHYRIIAFVGSPQKAWIASLRFLCDSALSELVTGFVGAFYLRVPVRL